MAMVYAIINGRVVIPGTLNEDGSGGVGIRARIDATPLTRDTVLTFPSAQAMTEGPVTGYSRPNDGVIEPAMKIPTGEGAAGVVWEFRFTPLDKNAGVKPWTRRYSVTTSGRLEDLVETEALTVTPELVTSVQTYATAAEQSATDADGSATAAAGSATSAQGWAEAASSSAADAATDADAAAVSEANAAGSAASASTSAGDASSSATAAAGSATAAATSETNAATSESNASTSAGQAASSATAAATSETNAANSAAAAQAVGDTNDTITQGLLADKTSASSNELGTAAQDQSHPLGAALTTTIAQVAAWARNPDQLIAGVVTRDANGAATSAPVVWPDGTPGTYTADTVSTAFPGAVDAYHITYGSPVTKTFTQPLITRDASGAAANVPAITVA